MFEIHQREYHLACASLMSYPAEIITIVVCCVLGVAWAIYNIFEVEQINVRGGFNGELHPSAKALTKRQESLLLELGDKISEVLDC